MCMFNTGCPGWTGGYEDGFVPCSEDLGCATAYAESLSDLHEYPIESKGRYDRYATGPEDSEWVCGDCGMVCDPDTHHEECQLTYSSIERYYEDDNDDNDMEDSLFYRLTASQLGFHKHGECA